METKAKKVRVAKTKERGEKETRKERKEKDNESEKDSKRIADLEQGRESSKIQRQGYATGSSKVLQVDSCL